MAKQSSQDSHAVEGEIIDKDDKAGQFSAKGTKESGAPSQKEGRPLSFYVAMTLTVFTLGLFAYPWMAAGLNGLFPGLLPESGAEQSQALSERIDGLERTITNSANTVSAMNGRIDTLSRTSDADMQALTRLQTEIDALKSEIQQIDERPAGAQDNVSVEQLNRLNERVLALENSWDELSVAAAVQEDRPAASSGAIMRSDTPAGELFTPQTIARINDIDQRLVRVESRISEAMVDNPQIRLFPIAAARLSRLVEQSQPFSSTLEEVRVLVGTLAPVLQRRTFSALETLDPLSERGVQSLDGLKEQFPQLAIEALSPSLQAEEPGFFESIWIGIKSLISVRRTGDVEGESDEAIIARAEISLAANDLGAALAAINGLSDAAASVFEGWREAAEQRHNAISAADTILNIALDEKTSLLREQ